MARQLENTERINVHLTIDQLGKLRIKAKEMGMSVSGYVRLLIIEDGKQMGTAMEAPLEFATPSDFSDFG
jgi:hypothetical protein